MDMNQYQTKTSDTAVYPGSGTGNITALAYVGLGLGEAGEIQGKIKKIMRDDHGQIEAHHRIELAKELGDLLWYVARAADEAGFHLGTIAQMNLDKLASRQSRGVIGGSGDNR